MTDLHESKPTILPEQNASDTPALTQETEVSAVSAGNNDRTSEFDPWKPGAHLAEKPERKPLSIRKKTIIGAAAAGVAGIVLAVGLNLPKATDTDNGEAPVPDPDATSEVTPSPEPEATSGEIEVLEQTVSFEQMEAMSIEEFGRLPYVDRAAYAYLKNPTMAVAPVDETFEPSTAVGYYWQAIQSSAVSAADTSDGAKIIAALDYYTTDLQTGELTDAYKTSVNSILETGGAGVGISEAFIHQGNGETQQGFDRSGNPIEFTNVTYAAFSTTGQGEQIGSERTAQVFQIPIKLSDGRTVMTFPRGYTIEGTQSPVEGYPY